MGNYSLVVNSKFQPFSFERYIQPYQIYGQAYREVENQYSDLATKANVWEKLANEQTDPYAYKMYKTYANDLATQAESLAKEGLNPTSRQSLLNMRKRYSSEITPIEQAYAARAEEAKSQYEGKAKGIVYEGDASSASLDRYISNPALRYNQANSQEGFKRVGSAAAALARGLRDYGNGKRLDSFTKTWLQEHGYRGSEIASAISDVQKIMIGDTNVNSNGVLRAILQDEMKTAGVDTWSNQAAINDYFSRVAPALYQAVGQTTVAPYEDYDARLMARQAASSSGVTVNTNRYRVNPLPLRSPQEITEKNKQIEDFIKKGYLMRTDNGLTLTKRGLSQLKMDKFVPLGTTSWEQYKKDNPNASRSSYETMLAEAEMKTAKPTLFSSWYNQNIGGYDSLTGKVDTPTTRLNKYESSVQGNSYDVYHTTEYDRQLDSDYGKEFMTQIWSNAGTEDGKKKVQGVEFNGRDGWSKTKTYDKSDLEGYRVTNVRYSRYGNTAILQSDKEGKNDIIRIKVPKGINIGAEINVDSAIGNTEDWNNILQTGKKPIITSDGRIAKDSNNNIVYTDIPLSESDIIVARQKRSNSVQDIYGYGSQTVVPSQTTSEQINPWY